jgi:hypothetical protein
MGAPLGILFGCTYTLPVSIDPYPIPLSTIGTMTVTTFDSDTVEPVNGSVMINYYITSVYLSQIHFSTNTFQIVQWHGRVRPIGEGPTIFPAGIVCAAGYESVPFDMGFSN